MQPVFLELLSPAKDLACGVAAIDHGADAVYIGAPQFSARAAAHNSLGDIAKLVEFAHQFGARVYVALNTLFNDQELVQAVGMIHELHAIGADAVIIQDVGLLECDLPPIALHASTQMNNRTPEKVAFLEKEGLSQVVLARELSLRQIRAIADRTRVSLEFFVHGALCVSYSGQCYISEVMTGRSANRGECAQFCRHRYTLSDKSGKVLAQDKYLLSLKDLDLSSRLRELIDAGITSFKIEGRLKDSNYVKNVTARYRQAIDAVIAERPQLRRSSSGTCRFNFQPDTRNSFNRGGTEYYLVQGKNCPATIDTPKSIGKELGKVTRVFGNGFVLETREKVANGDGLCFFDKKGDLIGFRVNRVAGNEVYTREPVGRLQAGTVLFRNHDVEFNRLLEASAGCRQIGVWLTLNETAVGLELEVQDGDGCCSTVELAAERQSAAQKGIARRTAERQLVKSGGTIFAVEKATADVGDDSYYPTAVFNEIRRLGLEQHRLTRIRRFAAQAVPKKALAPEQNPCPTTRISFSENIMNSKAEEFYRKRGATVAGPLAAAEVQDCAMMTTRYCVRQQLGICPNAGGGQLVRAESLLLADKTGRYELVFHCGRCEMTLHRLSD